MATLNKNPEAITNTPPEGTNTVSIVNGVGNAPTIVTWQDGDTVQTVLDRAHIYLSKEAAVTLGRKRIRNLEKTTVRAGDTLVIAGKVSNG